MTDGPERINPIGFRLALNRNWSARWYANTKNFSSMLLDDIKVRDYLKSSSPTQPYRKS